MSALTPVRQRTASIAAIQARIRVIYALMLRETKTKYGRLRIGYLWALIEPILFISVFFVLLTIVKRTSPSGMPLIPFLVTGVMPFILYRDSLMGGIQAFRANRPLLTFPQVSLFDLVFARALLNFCTHFVAVVLLILAIVLITGPMEVENILSIIFWFALAGAFGFGIGLAAGSFAVLAPTIEYLVPAVIVRPMFFISGVFFTAEMMPEPVRDLALINPLFHLIELQRSAFFVEFESTHASPGYVIISVLSMVCFGLVTQRALRRKILMAPPS